MGKSTMSRGTMSPSSFYGQAGYFGPKRKMTASVKSSEVKEAEQVPEIKEEIEEVINEPIPTMSVPEEVKPKKRGRKKKVEEKTESETETEIK